MQGNFAMRLLQKLVVAYAMYIKTFPVLTKRPFNLRPKNLLYVVTILDIVAQLWNVQACKCFPEVI